MSRRNLPKKFLILLIIAFAFLNTSVGAEENQYYARHASHTLRLDLRQVLNFWPLSLISSRYNALLATSNRRNSMESQRSSMHRSGSNTTSGDDSPAIING
jgi:hypothetical protein